MTGDVDQAHKNDAHASYAFGAQFAEARVHADTGEIRVPRLLGIFAAGRIINPRTARSQFIGGMAMGLSMALHEASVMDPHVGQVVNHDLAGYHIAANADVTSIEAHWLDEDDPYVNAMGSKGIGARLGLQPEVSSCNSRTRRTSAWFSPSAVSADLLQSVGVMSGSTGGRRPH